ncbi:hypothetical protein BpHYR1_024670 [Brachionus plicatilis]|uniref:Uncharacterized protein n=1 Tax=Brachionus plicatilis TaxID=10195 RepID=A0A3M7QUW4_BRAPC|nr:hypothetical protein BpHYR1_024670 [Brachionus plicatilis]
MDELLSQFESLNLIPSTRKKKDGSESYILSTIKSHPHLLSLIDSLKLKQSNTENVYIKLTTGQVNKRKALEKVVDSIKFNNENQNLDFLDKNLRFTGN